MTVRARTLDGPPGRAAGARSAAARPAAARPGKGRPPAAARATPRRAGTGLILLVVALLAGGGLAGALLVRQGTERAAPAETRTKRDPSRIYAVADAIDHRQMQPVWTLVNMTGLQRLCEKARAFTVARESEGTAAVPTRFVVYCRDQGFWVVEADPVRERWGTVGPLATREEVEAVIDREGEFVWGTRPPRQRSFVGGLAPDR